VTNIEGNTIKLIVEMMIEVKKKGKSISELGRRDINFTGIRSNHNDGALFGQKINITGVLAIHSYPMNGTSGCPHDFSCLELHFVAEGNSGSKGLSV
jgi:hypothetical protein